MSTPRLLLDNAADKLPSPSGVALALMQLWDDDNTTVEQLTRLIQTDPALCGRLLKLANSAAMGTTRRVAAIPEAIVRVGMRTVGQIAVTFSLIENASDGHCEAFDYPRFWSHCLLMAVLGRALAQATAVTAPDDMFACALLARIGKLAFATIYPLEYAEVLRAPGDLCEQEREYFGFDHNELSLELMRDYGVPEALAEPARHHEAPAAGGFAQSSRSRRIAEVLHLAHLLAERALSGETSGLGTRRELQDTADRLELSTERLGLLFDAAIVDWRDWSQMLELPAVFDGDYEAIRSDEAGAGAADGVDAYDADPDGGAPQFRAALLGDSEPIRRIAALLEQSEFVTRLCPDQTTALHAAVTLRPQLLVVDACGAALDADHFCRLVRSTEWGASTYVNVVVPEGQAVDHTALFHAGADAVVCGSVTHAEFQARLQAIQRYLGLQVAWQRDRAQLKRTANELAISHYKVEQLSLTDQLTHLPNRRAAMLALEQAWSLSERTGSPMALVMIDMDHFKAINDRHGHGLGDEVLRATARIMAESVRKEESICRFGGEEFLLVSPVHELKPMIVAAERLRRQVAALELEHQSQRIRPTISMGVVQRDAADADINALLSAADKAMYVAKQAGRNTIGFRVSGQFRVANTKR